MPEITGFWDADFGSPYILINVTLIFFIVIFIRYIAFSSMYHYLLYHTFKSVFQEKFLHKKPPSRKQFWKEIKWAGIGSAIFAISGAAMIYFWYTGKTRIYIDIHEYSLWYIPLSIVAYLLIHETYYYWLHRWMHKPGIYHRIHKVHHDSVETSAFTSFSFHPAESFLQSAIIPLLAFVIPIHWMVLLALLVLMTISAIVNHAGVEIFPVNGFLQKNVIGASHHDVHHKLFRYNFGLYFTFWDKWMGTEKPDGKN
jgi:Delta7-sterol 5-desaturase